MRSSDARKWLRVFGPRADNPRTMSVAQVIDGLERRATWRTAALAIGTIVLANLAMQSLALADIQARRPEALDDGFLVMIDREPLLSAAEVYRIFDLYTPDILGSVRLLYALDFVVPLAVACLCLALLGKMLRYLGARGIWRVCLLLPFVAPLFDYTENALVLFLVGQYQDGQVWPTLASAASVATACKFAALSVTGLVMVVLLVRVVARRVGSRN